MKVNLLTAEMQDKKKDHIQTTVKEIVSKKMLSEWHAYWLIKFYKWFLDYGVKKENIRLREHLKDELAHYSKACFDIEYKFPFGWKEIHGCADRSDFDLRQHIKHSKSDLSVFDEETKEKVVPHVIEPSQGIERAMLVFLFDAYNDDKKRGNVVLKLHPKIAPVKIGIFPLVNKLNDEAKKIYDDLKCCYSCLFDKSGSIGRRYARADEIGIPFCITVDFDTLKDNAITIRHRDSTKQERVPIKDIRDKIFSLTYT